jgi:hypothetical protein
MSVVRSLADSLTAVCEWSQRPARSAAAGFLGCRCEELLRRAIERALVPADHEIVVMTDASLVALGRLRGNLPNGRTGQARRELQ